MLYLQLSPSQLGHHDGRQTRRLRAQTTLAEAYTFKTAIQGIPHLFDREVAFRSHKDDDVIRVGFFAVTGCTLWG